MVSEASPEDMAKPVISREEFARVLKQRGYTDAMIQDQLDQLEPGWDIIDMGEDETPEEVAEKVASFYLTDAVCEEDELTPEELEAELLAEHFGVDKAT